MHGRMIVKLIALAGLLAAPALASAGFWVLGVYYTKGVMCDLTAGGLGNAQGSTDALTCEIGPPATQGAIVGLVECQNPGGNNPPGLFPASVSNFATLAPIQPWDITKNGKVSKRLVADASSQYPELVVACPNPNYTVVDFVPCAFTVTSSVVDTSTSPPTVLGAVTYDCALDSCLSLQVDKKTGLPQQTPYTCTKR